MLVESQDRKELSVISDDERVALRYTTRVATVDDQKRSLDE